MEKSKRDFEPYSFLEVNPLYSPLKSCCRSAREKYTMEKTFLDRSFLELN